MPDVIRLALLRCLTVGASGLGGRATMETAVRRPWRPAGAVPGREREDLHARLGHRHGVLELAESERSRVTAATVGEHLHRRAPEIDHRLHREELTGLELHVVARLDVVQDGRGVVIGAPEAVAAEIPHHRAALGLRVGLDRPAISVVDPPGLIAAMPRIRHSCVISQRRWALARHLAHIGHAARIAVPAIDDEADVELTMSPSRRGLSLGMPWADHVVDRGADRLRVTRIEQRGRIGAVIHGEGVGELVELFRGDDGGGGLHQQLRGPPPASADRPAHALETLRSMDRWQGGTASALGDGGFVLSHGVRFRADAGWGPSYVRWRAREANPRGTRGPIATGIDQPTGCMRTRSMPGGRLETGLADLHEHGARVGRASVPPGRQAGRGDG